MIISFEGIDPDTIDADAKHIDMIDMGDGTHEQVEMPLCFWWLLENIIVERRRPLSAIISEIELWQYQGYATFENCLLHYLQWYAQGIIGDGEIPPLAPPPGDGDDTVHRD